MQNNTKAFSLTTQRANWRNYCSRHPFLAWLICGGYLAIAALILMFLAPISQSSNLRQPSFVGERNSLLRTVDSVFVPADRRDNHVAEITAIVNQYLANDATMYSSWEGSRFQLRSFFITLLVGLISVSYLRDTAKPDLQRTLMTAAILVTVVMYALDVHIADLMNRNLVPGILMNNTLPSIIHLQPNDSCWHYLDLSNISTIQDSLSQTHLCRKLNSMIRPALEQWLIYLLPLGLLGIKRSSI